MSNALGDRTKALIKDFLPSDKITKNLMFYDVILPYLGKSYNFTLGNILKYLKAVNLKDVNFFKFEQTITALNFDHICEELGFDDFKEEFCKCKDFLVEISNGNILDYI
jgi:hypothetical protein